MSSTETKTTTQVYRVYIQATKQAIWDAITKPEWSQKYGYGGSVEYDLRPGGPYRVVSSDEMRTIGAPEVMVDGEVIESDPPNKLVQTWRLLMEEAMSTEGFTRLTYEIKEGKGGVCRVTVTHDLEGAPGLALLVSGAMDDQGAGGGWSWVLSDLKSLLETGSGMEWQGDSGQRGA